MTLTLFTNANCFHLKTAEDLGLCSNYLSLWEWYCFSC